MLLATLNLKLMQWMTFFITRYNHDRALHPPGSACN